MLSRLKAFVSQPRVELRYALILGLRSPRLYDLLVAAGNAVSGSTVRMDACTRCQLRCPDCPTGRGTLAETVVGRGALRFESFARFVDDNPAVKLVELSNWGEILLNRELIDIVRHADERGVRLKAHNGVNLNHLTEELAEALVRHRFAHLGVSIDGASQQTYSAYRVRGDFDRVIENVRLINRFKAAHGSELPVLSWQFVIFGHNEHEIPAAREMARELGMRFSPKLSWNPDFSPVKDPERVRRESGLAAASRVEWDERTDRPYKFHCAQLWTSPQINWDGKLLGCCYNTFGDFGNVFEEGFENLLRSERYRHAKRMIAGTAPARDDVPCSRCDIYWKLHPRTNRKTER